MRKTLILVCLCLFIVSCGGGGGGSASPLTGSSSSATTTTTSSAAPSSDKLLGNFTFHFTLDQALQDTITIDHKGTTKTSEGTDIYLGHNTGYPTIIAAGAWYPSTNDYNILERFSYSNGYYVDTTFAFVIEGDKRLTGCMYFSVTGGNWSSCNTLNSSTSRKTARMSAMTGQSNAIWQDMALNAREFNSGASVREEDADIKARIAELQTALDSLGN